MKNPFLRLIAWALLLSLLIGLLVSGAGWMLGWHTSAQFSNGFFWSGGILIILGVLSVAGGYSMRSNFNVVYSQSAGDMNLGERTKRWVADMSQGYNTLIFLTLAGGVLVVLAILVGSTF